MLIIRVSCANKIVHVFIDQTECENIISKELVYLRVKALWQFYEFKHGRYAFALFRDGQEKAEGRERELIANEIIKNDDSLQRCYNSNYDPAALLSSTSVFGGTFTAARDFTSSPFITNRFI